MPIPTDLSAAPRRLRRVALGVVALALLAAGGTKLLRTEPSVTMINRYLPTPKAVRAGGCLEIALALWLISGRSPKLAPTVAAAALAGMALLVVSELRRDAPLPCGCFPTRTAPTDTAAVRQELSVAVGRDVFLAMLCGLAGALAPAEASVSRRVVAGGES
ncbi:MAG TPA: MauE/DoxX family redox-associated membrane protein [Tepidisphaeraceae bacterium]